jgi:hypothetical protein
LTTENWRPIPGFENYQVSDLGRVRNAHGLIRKVTCCPLKRYLRIVISKNCANYNRYVHRLVMLAFVGPCPDGMQVAHLDGDPTNCALSNLTYATPRQNNLQKALHGTQPRGEQCSRAKLTEMQARVIRRLPRNSSRDWAEMFGVGASSVWDIQEGNTWKHLGAVNG